MENFWNWAKTFGTHPGLDAEILQRIRILKVTTLVFVLGVGLNLPVTGAFLPEAYPVFWVLVFSTLAGSLTWFWIAQNRFYVALVWLYGVGLVQFSTVPFLVGEAHAVHYYSIPGAISLFLTVPWRFKKTLWTLLTLQGIIFLAIIWNFRTWEPVLDFSPQDATSYALVAWKGNVVGVLLAVLALTFYSALEMMKVERDLWRAQQRSERLLLNLLPKEIASRLRDREEDKPIADHFAAATVFFADIVDFTGQTSRRTSRETVQILDRIFGRIDQLCEQFGLEKIKTIGDCYMAVSGIPQARTDHLEQSLRMALLLQNVLLQEFPGIQMRIGIDTGPVVAGVIGRRKFLYDLWGDVVNTASRMESHGLAGEIQVTARVHAAAHHHFHFLSRGILDIKGKGPMEVYLLLREGNHVS